MTLLDAPWPAPYTHVLVPTDFGVTATHALHQGVGLARQQRAALTILHVFPGISSMLAVDVDHVSAEIVTQLLEGYRTYALRRLAALVPADLSGRVNCLVATGETVTAILQMATRLRVDLIVMGRPQRHGWRRLFARHLSSGVVRRAACAVLCVEAPSRYELVKA
jgi:nucleotide-binding universal stress UspA family protein